MAGRKTLDDLIESNNLSLRQLSVGSFGVFNPALSENDFAINAE